MSKESYALKLVKAIELLQREGVEVGVRADSDAFKEIAAVLKRLSNENENA